MSWTSTCPACGTVRYDTNTFTDITFAEAGAMNVAVTCAGCGKVYDATDGQPGTYSTTGGMWRQVADRVAALDQAEVMRLRQQAEVIQAGQDRQEAEALLRGLGWTPPATLKDRLEVAALALDLVEKLLRILGILLVAGTAAWKAEDVHRLFEQWFN